MENQTDVQPESSPVLEVPRDGAAYAEWRQTGKLPEAKPAQPKGDSAPPKESSAEGKEPKEKSAPASEAGNKDQERQKPPRDNAGTRLNEILEDLRKAGLTPAELKTYKREAQKATEQVEQPKAEPKAAPEKTENPTELKPPTKPKAEDFKTYEEFEAAKDKYFEDVADYKAAKKFEDFQLEQARNAAYQSVQQKLNEAKARYSDDPAAVETITATSRTLVSDQQIPLAVKSIIDQSEVWPDIVYTLGSKPEELQAFIKLAKENPGAAIRKLTTTLNQNNQFRAGLVKQLSQFSGKDLTGQLAGVNLSQLAPRGLAKYGAEVTGEGLVVAVAKG